MSSQDAPIAVARRALLPFLQRLADKPETIAVVILSNASGTRERLAFDERSDFDVGLVLDIPLAAQEWRAVPAETYRLIEARVPTWVPNFSFHVPVPWGSLEVNVNQLVYQYETDPRTEWSDGKCEAYDSTRETVVDRDGMFARLIEMKVARNRSSRSARLVRLASRLSWDIDVLPRRQRDRGEVLAAHLILNAAVDEVMEAVFLLNDRFVPSRKWRFHLLRKHRLLAPGHVDLLNDALQCDTASADDLERRIQALDALWTAVSKRSNALPERPYRAFAASRLQLRRATVGDACEAEFGGDARDIVNYLVLDSPCALARQAASQVDALSRVWAEQLRAAQGDA